MLQNPASKYHAFPPVDLADRQWPSRSMSLATIIYAGMRQYEGPSLALSLILI